MSGVLARVVYASSPAEAPAEVRIYPLLLFCKFFKYQNRIVSSETESVTHCNLYWEV
jgi:hypothetical protein